MREEIAESSKNLSQKMDESLLMKASKREQDLMQLGMNDFEERLKGIESLKVMIELA